MSTLTSLASLVKAGKGYDQAASYYEGDTKEFFSNAKMRTLLGNSADRYRINFARTPVDVLLERTEISGITCGDATASSFLAQVWDDNELGLDAKDAHKLAYEFGDSYLIAMPDDTLACGLSAYVHDPRDVRVFYDPQRPRVKHHAIQKWLEIGTGVDAEDGNGLAKDRMFLRVNVYYADHTELWVSSAPVDDGTGARITLDVESLRLVTYEDDEPNEYGVVPVFHFRTSRPYGRPEHKDAYTVQDMINKTLINLMVSMDAAGYPQRFVLSESGLTQTTQMAGTFLPPQDGAGAGDSVLGATATESSGFAATPGGHWLLSGAKSVGQFAAADSANFLEPVKSLVQQMAAVTDTPMHYFELAGGMPSGESYRAANAPLDKKTEDRQARFGVTWSEFFDYCQLVKGITPVQATVSWKPAQITTDKDSWDAANAQLQAGVPYAQVWRERGYPEQLIATWTVPPPIWVTPGPAFGGGAPVGTPRAGQVSGDVGGGTPGPGPAAGPATGDPTGGTGSGVGTSGAVAGQG